MKRTLLFCTLMLGFSIRIYGQAYDTSPEARTGRFPFGSYFDAEIDAVGLYNGNVSIDIPLVTLPGRDVSWSLRLTYNSQKWQTIDFLGNSTGVYTGGWKLFSPIGQYPIFDVQFLGCEDTQAFWTVDAYWQDGLGTKRRYTTDEFSTACSEETPTANLSLRSINSDISWLNTNANGDVSTITFKDGLVIDWENGRFVTPNGNYIEFGAWAYPEEETLGRTIGFSTNKGQQELFYRTYTVKDSNGTDRDYTLNLDDVYSIYNPIYQTSQNYSEWLLSIDLPNGKEYSFEYDHVQGFLTKINLPSGGYVRYVYHSCSGSGTCNVTAATSDYVVERRVSADGTNEKVWTYSRAANGTGRDVTVTSPEGHVVVHKFDVKGLENETQWKEGSTVVRKVERTWTTGAISPNSQPTDPRLDSLITTQGDVKRSSAFTYNVWFDVTQQDDSDWYPVSGSAIPLTRTTYAYEFGSYDRRVEDIAVSVWNGSSYGQQRRTEFVYDEYSLSSTPSGVPGKGTPPGTRFNLTTLKRYTGSSTSISEHFHYDDLGNTVSHVDPEGHTTQFSYADSYTDQTDHLSYAFPTLITDAVSHTVSVVYDHDTGLLITYENERGLETDRTYDLLNRPASITEPNGRVLSYTYDDTNLKVTETATVATGVARTRETYSDKLYRAIKTLDKDPDGDVTVETEFDGDGRVKKVSQPYRSGTPVWTQTNYDVLNRPITITNPDSTTVQFVYDDNTTKTTDEAGNEVVRTLNALGHLTKVEELRPQTSTLTTTYTYDVSGGLTGVSQYSAQTRSFTRDWLSRVTSETHPESGTTSHVYDNDSRVTSLTDARSTTATYTYDAIDRLLTTSYNDMVTPTVTRTYDQNGYTSLLTTVADGVGSTTYTYKTDSNLLASEARTFTGVTGTFTSSYDYDLEGKLTGITYPSGRQVTRAYKAASGLTAGQLNTLTNTVNSTSTTLLTVVDDNAAGQILGQTLGNGAAETHSFNSRLQLTGIDAEKSNVDLLDLTFGYGASNSNNGRIRSRTDAIQPEHSTNYTYDALQRLTKVEAPSGSWSITWGLDNFGNRTSQTPAGLASGRVGTQSIAYSSNKNSGWTYDYAGNVTNDQVYNYTYDGESRLIQVNSSAIQYAYDGYGRRVKKTANSVTTYYLHGEAGLMSEFTTASTGADAAHQSDRLEYRIGEQTGTPVLLMSAAGTVIENNRVFPFGELWSTPAVSTNQQNFTSYLRDGESGLDYAIARHYGSRSGRFMTADPGHIGASIGDPQSWNAYVYVGNDPINFIDPEGLCRVNGVEYPDGGPQCPDITSVTVTAPRPDPGAPLGLGPCFDPEFAYYCIPAGLPRYGIPSLSDVVDMIGRSVQRVITTVANLPPPDPGCMAKAAGSGMVVGGGLGTLAGTAGIVTGPGVLATVPGGAAGGASGGFVIGGAVGSVTCRFMASTGSGAGGNYRPKTTGANRADGRQITDAARRTGIDPREFGKYVEKVKKLEGRRPSQNFSFPELLKLAQEFKAGNR